MIKIVCNKKLQADTEMCQPVVLLKVYLLEVYVDV